MLGLKSVHGSKSCPRPQWVNGSVSCNIHCVGYNTLREFPRRQTVMNIKFKFTCNFHWNLNLLGRSFGAFLSFTPSFQLLRDEHTLWHHLCEYDINVMITYADACQIKVWYVLITKFCCTCISLVIRWYMIVREAFTLQQLPGRYHNTQ